MALTCLQIVQTVCQRLGLAAPTAAVASTDPQIVQILALSQQEGEEQAARYAWQSLQTEAVFTTVATSIQGAISTIAPGMDFIINNTIWNRTLRRPVYGPRSEQDWQQIVASQINGPFNSFRIMGDNLLFYPIPPQGQICAFEFLSRNWVSTASGTSAVWTSDADTTKLNDRIMIAGTLWRWRQAKGLDYADAFTAYEKAITDVMGRDAGKPILNMNGVGPYEITPVAIVPRGSWNV